MAKRTVAGPLTGETHLPQTTFHLPLSSLSSLPSTQTYSASPSSPSAASTARRTPSTPAFTRTKPAPVPALRLPTPGRPVWGALRGSLCQTSARSSRFSYLPCPRPRFPRFTSTTSPLTQLTSASPAPLRRNLFAAALLFYPADGLPTFTFWALTTRPRFPSLHAFAITNSLPSRRLPSPPARAAPTLRARFHIAGFISQIHLAHARQSLRLSSIIISSPIQQDGPCPSR